MLGRTGTWELAWLARAVLFSAGLFGAGLIGAGLIGAGPFSAGAEGAPQAVVAADETPIAAENVATLRKQVGESVTIVGRIARTGRSASGIQFLNFADSELTLVCGKQDAAKFKPKDPADQFRGQVVTVRGELELYRGKVRIRLRAPEQIEIKAKPDEKSADSPAKTESDVAEASSPQVGFALREIGKDSWISPTGLRYQGRDPEGKTRVEHIARHLEDQPSRDGPHGVFEGEMDDVFALIDEAWKLAQSRRIRPVVEGARSSYTVSLGRRIGYLGGRSGATQGHPPLTRVFIVFETGSKKIITAFPK